MNSPFFGEDVASGNAVFDQRTDVIRALALVAGSTGSVLATGGEFRQRNGLVRALGFDTAHPFRISIQYRSYKVDTWRIDGDGVGTADDPFGPGWRASWGGLLVAPNEEGEPIVRIDENGVAWTHTQVEENPVSPGSSAQSVVNRIYDGQAGPRLVLEHHQIGGQLTAVWFRESPDRTRHQYASQPNSGNDQVLSRVYRGDFTSPDWQVDFNYNAQGRLDSITDARGVVYSLAWTTYGTTQRVTKLSIMAPWTHNWAALDINFEYELSAPYCLQLVRKPARAFVDDLNRNGTYESNEFFTGEVITRYTCVPGSNRIERVYDESTGLARLQLEVEYDPLTTWRAKTLRVGEPSTLPGQGQRVHSFAYPQSGRMEWTDPRAVLRRYDFNTTFGPSPRQWRVTRIESVAGPNDPRPTGDPHHHASLVWNYTWSCGCGELTQITMPSGIKHVATYDGDGRGLVTTTGIIPVGLGAVQQLRTWTYRSWNDPDYRLASRLSGYTDAMGKVQVHTFTYDAAYGGYQVKGTFDGTELFTLQEDAGGRMLWREEGTFQVDGGGTSRKREGYQFGASSTAPDYLLVNRMDTYQGMVVVAWRTFSYAGLGWFAGMTDEKGRATTVTNDDIGLVRQGHLPTTISGRGGSSYGGTFQFEYDRYSQVAIAKRSAHDDLGAAYGRPWVEKVRVFDYFGRPWHERTDVARLDQPSPTWLTSTYEYDGSGRIQRILNSGGREILYLIDDYDRLYQRKIKLDATTWSVEQHGYHPDGVLAQVVEPTGLKGLVDGLDSWGRPQWIHLPGQKHVFLVRDNEDRLTTREYRVGPTGSTVLKRATAWSLDSLGRVQSESTTAPGSVTALTTSLTYNGPSRISTIVDGDGRGWTFGYDYLGQMVRRQDRLLGANGNAEVFTRDVMGVVSRIDHIVQRQNGASSHVPVTYRTDLVHDQWDRVIRVEVWGKAASLQYTRYRGYNSLGHATWSKDGVGKEVRLAYDAAGRKVDQWVHQRNVALPPIHLALAYDDSPADPLVSATLTRTDGIGNTTEFRYDLFGRMVERRLPGYAAGSGSKRWRYSYDLAGRLTGWVDGNGTTIRQVHDSEGRRQRREVLQLPTNGVLLSRLATEESWAYDDFDRVISSQTWWSIYPQLETGELPNLVEAVDLYDGIGRQTLERFRYLDDASPGYTPLATKDLTYGFARPGGGEDATLQRSMTTSSGFSLTYSPDGAGKLGAMTLVGPGIGLQNLADWRYEGARTIRTSYEPGVASGPNLIADLVHNDVRHMTRSTTNLVAGTSTLVFDLELERDPEGNVLQHRFSKAGGKAGDWFALDGWDRLQEVKMGVTSFGGTYQSASGYDEKITYALDAAHNRQSVVEETSGTSTTYTLQSGTNEYSSVTDPYGSHSWLYDGNGNLLSDGYFLYVYDYLDRLSEVYLLTYPGGATVMSSNGQRVVRVFGIESQRARNGKPTRLTRKSWREMLMKARTRVTSARAAAKVPASDPRVPANANSGTESAGVEEPQIVFVASYGYDPFNRRVGKMLPDDGAFYVWAGWELTEAHDSTFQPSTVWFEGAALDEHLGYAVKNGQGGWDRYSYVLDHRRGVARVTDSAGVPLERYEFDPYGRMAVFSPSGQPRGTSPTVTAQVFGFAGAQLDVETGLQYHRNRYYSPTHGRFLTQDPSGVYRDAAALGNSYCYAASGPVKWWDPFGLFTIVIVVSSPSDGMSVGGSLNNARDTAAKDPEGGLVVHITVDKDGNVKTAEPEEVDPATKTSKKKKKKKKKKKRPSNSKVIVLAEGSKKWRTDKAFGNGSNIPGGEDTIAAIFAALDNIFAGNDPRVPSRPVPGGGGIRGPTTPIRVWACHAAKKDWQVPKKRGKSLATALADRYGRYVLAYDCVIPGKIDDIPPGMRPPKPVRVHPAEPPKK